MILIADSGSTKTHWCLLNEGIVTAEIFTDGINPFYQNTLEIIELLQTQLIPNLESIQIQEVYFYGAGCSYPDKKLVLSQALFRIFGNAILDIQSDLLAASRALFQHKQGIACILGTGSNSCYYNGEEIIQNVSPLGFILGDEGSGAVLGKLLLADCLKNQMPDIICKTLFEEYNLTPASILENVYKMPFPNRFLAKFTPFILKHIQEPAIFNLVYDSFDSFFIRNVMQYNINDLQVGFVGSISYYFRDTLEIVASEHAIVISEIIQNPMSGLIRFHTNQ